MHYFLRMNVLYKNAVFFLLQFYFICEKLKTKPVHSRTKFCIANQFSFLMCYFLLILKLRTWIYFQDLINFNYFFRVSFQDGFT